jgi:DNA-binding NarL/FixJ family response regulator
MKPITQQQIVHLRLLTSLPVRTHHRPEEPQPGGNVHYLTSHEYNERKKRIRALKKEGKTPKEIAVIEKVSTQTIYNHLRARTDY